MDVADRIRTLREQMGMSQDAFADAIGRSRSLIAAWETGRKEPGRSALERISDVCGVSMEWIVLGDERRPQMAADGADEIALLKLWRHADEATRAAILHLLKVANPPLRN